MSNLAWLGHLDKVLTILAAVLAGGHLLHWFSQEWIVLAATIVAAISTFIGSRQSPAPTPDTTPAGDSGKRASQ